jgi:hypothetical protein
MKYLAIFLMIIILGCSVQEDYLIDRTVTGLYKRDFFDQVEYICLKKDSTYNYFVEDSLMVHGEWDYTSRNQKSMIGLNGFDYSLKLGKYTEYTGYSMPIKYSHAKDAVLLRMDADDHFKDFIRVDSISCSF